MKIGLIGLGYWGKIILKNLEEMGYRDLVICEKQEVDWQEVGSKYPLVKDYRDLGGCDKVFVLTPATLHYEVCKHFLERGVDVFCEKPLDLSSELCRNLFSIAAKNESVLFVDWLFVYNPAVKKIKSLISQIGKPKNIIANRMNYGPVRHDVNARWDLASHDVSIASYILDEEPKNVQWLDFRRDSSSAKEDSVVGILTFENTCVQINASWSFGNKNRLYTLEFDSGFLYWNDSTRTLTWGGEDLNVEAESPLHNSIEAFLSGKTNESLTLEITKILNR